MKSNVWLAHGTNLIYFSNYYYSYCCNCSIYCTLQNFWFIFLFFNYAICSENSLIWYDMPRPCQCTWHIVSDFSLTLEWINRLDVDVKEAPGKGNRGFSSSIYAANVYFAGKVGVGETAVPSVGYNKLSKINWGFRPHFGEKFQQWHCGLFFFLVSWPTIWSLTDLHT